MRKLILAVLVVLLLGSTTATTFSEETITVDLATSEVNADIRVEELTSTKFTFFTEYDVSAIRAQINGKSTSCQVNTQGLRSEIRCDVPEDLTSFDARLNFTARDLVRQQNNQNTFQYSQNIIRPTENFTLQVLLPEGAGLSESGNVSASVSPQDAEITTNGRRIIVEWTRNPRIGDRLSFQILYEQYANEGLDLQTIILAAIAGALLITAAYFAYRRMGKQSVENVYEDLNEDQIAVLEILRDNEGQMLQKDLVETMDYSKAKVSGLVSELVEKEVVIKQKEGRSNMLSISKNYRV